MAFSIALAKQADLEQIVTIYNQSILTKKSTADLIEVTVADRQPWFEMHLQRPIRPIYVLKNDSGTVMAWGCFSDFKSRPAYDISAEISIYVHQQYHRRGLASLFLQWMLTQAPQLGIRNILALIFSHNQPSLALFSKFGFETWGTMPQVCDMQTFVADVVMLGKSVVPANNS
ncbi:N-acetyltransferase [Psychrobacter sp. FDAARGOS_221]|nr:N-acetyltransferase [Psychrobacter sp. FDAARGOS_221]